MNENKLTEIEKILLKSIPWPIWVVDPDSKVILINTHYESTYNITLSDCIGKNITEIFNSDKVKIYNKKINEVIETKQVRVTKGIANGIWLECTCFPLIGEDNEIKAVAGIIIDVDKRVKKEKEVKEQKNILRTIIDAVPETIFYKDNESRFIGYNERFLEFYKTKGVDDILGKTDLEIYPDKEVAAKFMEQDKEIMKEKKPRYYEFEVKDRNGNIRIEENVKIPVIDNEGEAWGIVGLSRDITERKILEERLRYLSEIDVLTGLYNRHSFEEKIKELSKEKFLPLGIVMGDVNGLKLINDTIGHIEGDKLIVNISEVLKKCCKDKGYIFRWGGDEFIILLPNYTEDKCEKLVENIIMECNNRKSGFIKLSISLGVAVKNTEYEDIYECIKKAEENVYHKKLLGKKNFKSSIIDSLCKNLEQKNMETKEHTDRIVNYAILMGDVLNFNTAELDELIIAAKLHDIGKIAIEEDILFKPGKLTDEEFEIVKKHTEKGYRIVNESTELYNVAKVVLTHHERWDGKGYPLGIKGKEIPLMARIINIIDSYDAMTSDRVYKKGISKQEAIRELQRCAGTQFDPELVQIFINEMCK